MQIVNALHQLDFSFWQVVVVGVILVFRAEFRRLFDRIATLKFLDGEITLRNAGEAVSDLKDLKEEIEARKVPDTSLVQLIEHKIANRALVALANIKRNTTYLWPALLRAKQGDTITTAIRSATLERVVDDLGILAGADLLSFELQEPNARGVRSIVVRNLSPRTVELIHQAGRDY